MDTGEDKVAAVSKFFCVRVNCLINLVIRGMFRDQLCIIGTAPENDIFAETLFQRVDRHIGSGGLHRIEDLDTAFNQVSDDIGNGTAGMQIDLHASERFPTVKPLFVIRLVDFAPQVRTDRYIAVISKIVGNGEDVHIFANSLIQQFDLF